MKHITVFRDESIYASHASACIAANGDVLVAFRQSPLEQIFAHVHPRSTVGLVRSTDGGETFDKSTWTTVLDPGAEFNLNDPSITTLSDGTIVLTAFVIPCPYEKNKDKWGERAFPVRGNDYYFVGDEREIYVRRSFDNGHTWDGPFIADTSAYGRGSAGVFANVVELSDGTILMPITEHSKESQRSAAALLASRDKGKTWEPYSIITRWTSNEEESGSFGLPSVLAYDDKHMHAVGWSPTSHGTLVTSSYDGGHAWTPTRPVNTQGSCFHLCLTRSGSTVMSYGFRNPPYGIHVLPSDDRGETWDMNRAAALRCDGAMRDIGYPWTIQLADDRLFCVYYFNVHEDEKSYYDEKKSAEICAKWNLAPELYTYKTAGLRFIGATLFTEAEMASLAGTGATKSAEDESGPTLL